MCYNIIVKNKATLAEVQMAEKCLTAENMETLLVVFGQNDENLRLLEKEFNTTIICRGTEIKVTGDDSNVQTTLKAVDAMISLYNDKRELTSQAVWYCISLAKSGEEDKVKELLGDTVLLTAKAKPVRPKTLGQKKYLSAIKNNAITFGVGPAGTGKTYLAVAMAVKAFKAHEVERIILTRPAVEAGEKLGFLPGDMQNKVDPYLRPLYDALFDMLGVETYQKLFEKQAIEVAPLAYMRGRTLDNAFIILDEAQNTSPEQMKMFLTRMGADSKVIVTGDVTQIDLPDKTRSGLVDALRVLAKIEGIAQIRLTEKDVVRHKLVQDIIKAYEKPTKPRAK